MVSKPVCVEESSGTHKNTTLGDSGLIVLGWGLGIGSFEEFPRGSTMLLVQKNSTKIFL